MKEQLIPRPEKGDKLTIIFVNETKSGQNHLQKSPAFTAEWVAIAKGKSNKDVFINNMKDYAKTIVYEIKNSKKKY